MRTIEEIKADLRTAYINNEASALLLFADELDGLATREARAIAGDARGCAFNRMCDYDSALESFGASLTLLHELGDLLMTAKVSNGIGNVLYNMGDFPTALSHYHVAMDMYERVGYQVGVAAVIGNIGNIYNITGNYPAALEYYCRGLALYRENNYYEDVANCTANIGNVYYNTGDNSAALESYESALEIYRERGDQLGMAKVTAGIGSTYGAIGDDALGLEQLYRALTLHKEIGNSAGEATVSSSILYALLDAEDVDAARKALSSLDELTIHNPAVFVQREIGRAGLRILEGDLTSAHTVLSAALLFAREHELRASEVSVLSEFRTLAQKRGDLTMYVEYNNEYTRINEEIRGKAASISLAMQAKEREIAEKDKEHAKQLAVLHSALPKHVADRVARGEVVNDHFENATVMFLDVAGFTTMSAAMTPHEVITMLEELFSICDEAVNAHNMMKIKTIGDSYMAVSFESATSAARAALDILRHVSARCSYACRIGLHCGPVVTGVIGKERMQYDVWGDTVNTASRMESSSMPGRVHVSQAFAFNLKRNTEYRTQNSIEEEYRIQNTEFNDLMAESRNGFVLVERGEIDVKGKGMMTTYWLERGRSVATDPALPNAAL